MIIILGLVILVAALVVAVAGVLSNDGSAHAVAHFSVLDYHLTGSAGALFLAGIVVGAVGLLGLSVLLAGARRASRRGSAARRGLRQSRRETAAASQERDDLIGQRDTAWANTTSNLSNDASVPHGRQLSGGSDRWRRLRDIRRRLAPAQAASRSDAIAGRAVSEFPASTSDSGVAVIAPASDVTAGASDPDVAVISPALNADASASAPAK